MAPGALVNANLENNTGYGSGYRLGYFDRDLDFVELGRTGSKETRITMVKAQNTWVSGSSYSNSDNGGAVIGSYHLQVETCSSYEGGGPGSGGLSGWLSRLDRWRIPGPVQGLPRHPGGG